MNNSSKLACCVIIPTYNGENFIGETLESVFTQKLAPAEIIVIDDKSTDNTLGILSRFKRIRLYQNRKNNGPGVSRRFGLEQTRSPLVAFLDQDDIWHPLHLQLLHDEIIAHPETPAAVSQNSNFLEGGKPVFFVEPRSSASFDAWDAFPLFNHVSSPSAALINRTILERAGGWIPQYTGSTDYNLWLRLSAHQPLRFLNTVTIGRCIHRNSLYHKAVYNFPLRRMKLRYKACANALEYLINHNSGIDNNKIETATSRMRFYRDVCMFAEAMIKNRPAEVPGLVGQIANFLESSPGNNQLNIFIHLQNTFPQHRIQLLTALDTHWPEIFSGTRDELHRGLSFYDSKGSKQILAQNPGHQ